MSMREERGSGKIRTMRHLLQLFLGKESQSSKVSFLANMIYWNRYLLLRDPTVLFHVQI